MNALEKAAPPAWLKALLGILVVTWLGARFLALPKMMTHVDDIAELTDLLEVKDQSWRMRIKVLKPRTFAPGQFFATDLLLQRAHSPKAVLWMGRGVSFCFWLAGVLVFAGLLGKLGWSWGLNWFLMAILLFSWRGIIESSQAYNYAAAFFSSSVILYVALSKKIEGFGKTALTLLGLGALIGLSYQAIFFSAAILGVLVIRDGRRGLLRNGALGVGLLVWIAFYYKIQIYQYADRPAHPPWAPYPHGLKDLALGWFQVFENNLTMLPWGWKTAAFTACLIALAAFGYFRRQEKISKPILLVGLYLFSVWSAGALSLRFPCGATRHTFVLQPAVLLLLGAGLSALRFSNKTWLGLSAGLGILFLVHLPGFARGLENRVDLDEIERLLAEDPQLVAWDSENSFTRDPILLLSKHPDWKPRLRLGDFSKLKDLPQRVLLACHRGALAPATVTELESEGYQLRLLRKVEPLGSTELSGDINGGNGFYLYLAERPAAT
ncbi:MAG: hypothetical protein V4498_06235 [candidate division FCPU426 bacterium]